MLNVNVNETARRRGVGQHPLWTAQPPHPRAAALPDGSTGALNRRRDLSGAWFWPGATRWSTGDRGVSCYLFVTHSQKVVTSLRHRA